MNPLLQELTLVIVLYSKSKLESDDFGPFEIYPEGQIVKMGKKSMQVLEMKDEDLETENVGQDRPRSGKEARQRRAERIASASGRDRKIESDDSDLETDTEDDQPVNYEEYER